MTGRRNRFLVIPAANKGALSQFTLRHTCSEHRYNNLFPWKARQHNNSTNSVHVLWNIFSVVLGFPATRQRSKRMRILSLRQMEAHYICKFDKSCNFPIHYNDIIMGAMASQITSLTIVTQPLIQAKIKDVSIWWRHHNMMAYFNTVLHNEWIWNMYDEIYLYTKMLSFHLIVFTIECRFLQQFALYNCNDYPNINALWHPRTGSALNQVMAVACYRKNTGILPFETSNFNGN